MESSENLPTNKLGNLRVHKEVQCVGSFKWVWDIGSCPGLCKV